MLNQNIIKIYSSDTIIIDWFDNSVYATVHRYQSDF